MTCAHVSPLHTLAATALALLAGGCAAPYRFSVDAYEDREAASSSRISYQLVAARSHDLDRAFEAKVRDILRTALSTRGMFEADLGGTADMSIEFDAGISGPLLVERTYAKPEYVVHQIQVPTGFGGGDGASYVVETLPELQPARLVTEHVLEYRKHLDLVARTGSGLHDDRPRRELWRVHVENQDGSRDLRRTVTLMAAAALDLIGTDAGMRRTVTLTDRDQRVLCIQVGTP